MSHVKVVRLLGSVIVAAVIAMTPIQSDADDLGGGTGHTKAQLLRMKPTMYKYEEYPPVTQDGLRMWQWWRAMGAVDPCDFEWGMPITFYGKVVDQSNSPVSGATIWMDWSAIGGTRETNMQSDADGLFSISGLVGKSLSVQVVKDGYFSGEQADKDFEYAEFFNRSFHVPDSTNPVVFSLRKYGNREPMYKSRINAALHADGRMLWFNCRTGQPEKGGEIGLGVNRYGDVNSRDSAYTIIVKAAPGCGIIQGEVGEDGDMFSAPESGYSDEIRFEQAAARGPYDETFCVSRLIRLYLQTTNGVYGSVKSEISQNQGPYAHVNGVMYLNPSGSRNLEFDEAQQIKVRKAWK